MTNDTATAQDVIAEFIAQEVGYEAPGMREQAGELIAALAAGGWSLVRSAAVPASEGSTP